MDLEYLLNAASALPAPPPPLRSDVESVSTYLEGLAMSQQQPAPDPASALHGPLCVHPYTLETPLPPQPPWEGSPCPSSPPPTRQAPSTLLYVPWKTPTNPSRPSA